MVSYLIKSSELPFTGADICAELGIDAAQFSFEIEGMIGAACCDCPKQVLTQTWWITDDDRFEAASRAMGEPVSVAEPHEWNGDTYRACVYQPNVEAVATVRALVIERARQSNDLRLAMAIHSAERVAA